MPNVLLGVTGSVAAIRTPMLYDGLTQAGFTVKVVSTDAATYFFDPNSIASDSTHRNREAMILDSDEWPEPGYTRGDRVLHIDLRNWADLFLIAPLDANTLAKLAYGLSDNCLTCVWRAWDIRKPVLLAPAMNTLMWDHPLTRTHIRLLDNLNESKFLEIIPPIEKTLACGDVGVGAMAEVESVIEKVKIKLG